MSEPREGWYAVLWGGRFATVIQRRENGWHDPHRNECSEKWPYIEWTLGPRIDWLMLEAARYRYVKEELSPEDFATVPAEELDAWDEIAKERGE